MPAVTKSKLDGLFSKVGYVSERESRSSSDAVQRAAAKTILAPMDVAGEYDFARVLFTTLGGQVRPITVDDLKTFQGYVRKLGKKFKGGITAQGVIDHSLKEDLARANAEIRVATVSQAAHGTLHMITNAGPNSDVRRHHVTVQFPTYSAYAASPQEPKKLASAMVTGPLRFDCDCGRHRYWFRFIATKGNFNAGRDEPGFPKIRNPKLHGIACKHVLRAMYAILRDQVVRNVCARMIENGQQFVHKKITQSNAEMRAQAQGQLNTRAKRGTAIKQTAAQALKASMKKAVLQVAERAKKRAKSATSDLNAAIKKAAKLGVLTPAQLAAVAAILKGK